MAIERREVLKLGVVDLGVEKAELPDGVTVDLAVIRHPGASAIVALDEHRRATLIRQWRHAMGGWMWEVPAGCRRAGESAQACAERELSEEVGLGAPLGPSRRDRHDPELLRRAHRTLPGARPGCRAGRA
jgi:ADP-ribose pyrophosphatase